MTRFFVGFASDSGKRREEREGEGEEEQEQEQEQDDEEEGCRLACKCVSTQLPHTRT